MYEVTLVIGLLLIMTTIVLMTVLGLRARSEDTGVADERVTITLAAARFFTESKFTAFPVEGPSGEGARLRPIDFDAPLPQDHSRRFVPDFLREVPPSARLVKWQLDTVTGAVSIAEDGV